MFIINSTRVDNETLWVNVTYTLTDGTQLDLDVPVFIPQDLDSVLKALRNREQSEQSKYDAQATNQTIKQAIDTQIGVSQK